jgi:heme exporter protein A
MMENLLDIKNLSHPFISRTQNESISLSLQKGECVWVKGENGTGKSTFLKLIAGILPLEKGIICLSSRYSYLGAELGVKCHAAISDFEHFTATLGKPQTSNLQKEKEFNTLSSGQKLWVRLQAALLIERPLWILDEPTRFLDKKKEELLWTRVNQHCRNGGAVVFTSHTHITHEKINHIRIQI